MFGNKMSKIEKAIEKKKANVVVELIGDKDKATRIAAIHGCGKIGGDDCFNALIPMLHNTDPDIRIAVAEALGDVKNMHGRAFLSNRLNNESDPKVKEALTKALHSIPEKA